MKRLSVVLLFPLISAPAFAADDWRPQRPEPGKADPRICWVDYDQNRVLEISAPVQKSISIRFGAKEEILDIPVSNDVDLDKGQSRGTIKNILFIRAKLTPMEPAPIGVRTKLEDGTVRDYAIEWSAYDDHDPVMVASKDGVTAADLKPPPPFCFVINYRYPAEVKAAQSAAWAKVQAKKRDQEAEIALHQPITRALNNHYVGQGDTSIGPIGEGGADAISDDGFTTTLTFPGNMTIPTILTRFGDKTMRQPDGITHEQGGIVRLHGVYDYLKLIDGDRVLCIYNRGFSAIGHNPGTGTTNPNVERTVGTGRE